MAEAKPQEELIGTVVVQIRRHPQNHAGLYANSSSVLMPGVEFTHQQVVAKALEGLSRFHYLSFVAEERKASHA